jgi:hypothetical protein
LDTAQTVKSFLVLFFKKEPFLLFLSFISFISFTPFIFCAPASAADWPGFQIILYQSQTAAALRALREIGVSAAMLRARRDAAAAEDPHLALFRALGLRFYVENIATDFYSAYHRWQGATPVNAAFLADQARHRQDPTAIEPFLRQPSLVDQGWRALIAQRIARVVAGFRADHPLYYDLADEAGIADLSAAWDFDFSPRALNDFRAWLHASYHDLAALNREWGRHYRRWDEISPETTDEALRAGMADLAPWADFKAWMDLSFADSVGFGTKAVHAADPQALAALEGGQIPGWGGYDYTRLAKSVDVMEIYDFGASVAIARAMNARLITLMTIAVNDPNARAALWRGVLAGMGGVILWDEDAALASPDGGLGRAGRDFAPDFLALRGRLGDILMKARRPVDPIAILYSPASFRLRWLLDRAAEGGDWAARGADAEYRDNPQSHAIAAFLQLFSAHGVRPAIIPPAGLEAGDLWEAGIRVLILPETLALSAGEIAAIRRFAAAGGEVLATTPPGGFDEHGKRRAAPLADGAIRIFDPASADAGRDLAGLLTAAGLQPRFQLRDAAGGWPENVSVTRLEGMRGGQEIFAIESNGEATKPARSLTFTRPRACRVEELRTAHDFGMTPVVTVTLDPAVPTLLSCE